MNRKLLTLILVIVPTFVQAEEFLFDEIYSSMMTTETGILGTRANPSSLTANYPLAYEDEAGSNGTWPLIVAGDVVQPVWANRARNSILSIQKELGYNPSGDSSTLAERLNAETFRFAKDTYSGPYNDDEVPPEYATIRLEFGNQLQSWYEEVDQGIWELQSGAYEVYLEYQGENNRFYTPNSFQANAFFGSGANLTGVAKLLSGNVFSSYNRIGSSQHNPTYSSGLLYIGTDDGSTAVADNTFSFGTNQYGLYIKATNSAATAHRFTVESLAQNLETYFQGQGANRQSTLAVFGTGNAASSIVLGAPISSGTTAQGFNDNKLEISTLTGPTSQIVHYSTASDTTLYFNNYHGTYKMNVDIENNLNVHGKTVSPSIVLEPSAYAPSSPSSGELWIADGGGVLSNGLYVYYFGQWNLISAIEP